MPPPCPPQEKGVREGQKEREREEGIRGNEIVLVLQNSSCRHTALVDSRLQYTTRLPEPLLQFKSNLFTTPPRIETLDGGFRNIPNYV